jgi:hypothetical protein
MHSGKYYRCHGNSGDPMHDLASSGKQCIKSPSCDLEGRRRVKMA